MATFSADWQDCTIEPMEPWSGGTAPFIFVNNSMPAGEECGARGDGIVQLPFIFDDPQPGDPIFTLDFDVAAPGDSVGFTGVDFEIYLLSEDEQNGVSMNITPQSGTVYRLDLYTIVGGVKTNEALTTPQVFGGWQRVAGIVHGGQDLFSGTFNGASAGSSVSQINTAMANVSKIRWRDNDAQSTALINLTLTAENVTAKPGTDSGFAVVSGAQRVTFTAGFTP